MDYSFSSYIYVYILWYIFFPRTLTLNEQRFLVSFFNTEQKRRPADIEVG